MNQLIVNELHSFSIANNGGKLSLDGAEFEVDLQAVNAHTFHILHDNRSYTAEVVSLDRKEKKAVVKVNGNEYSVLLRDRYDLLLDNMGMQFSKKNGASMLKAPMPGLV